MGETPESETPETKAHLASRRRFLKQMAGLGGGALAALVIQACGGTPQAPAAEQPTAAPAAPAAATSAPAEQPTAAAAAQPTTAAAAPTTAPAAGGPKRGGKLSWGMNGDPVSLEPFGINTTGQYNYEARELMYDSLLYWDKDLKIQPGLALWYETPDDTTYVFKLRSGVKFHNGKELDADDVKYSLETVINPPDGKNPGAGFFTNFDKVEAVDKQTVKITMKKVDPTIPGLFSWSRYTSIVPKDMAKSLNPATEGIGTGPFKLVKYTPNKEINYTRYTEFWNKDLPYVDEMTYQVITDEDARIAALRSGSIDGCDVSALGARRLESEQGITLYKGLFAQPKVLQMTLRGDKPWDKKEVRQAMNAAINRQELIEKVAEGEAVLTGPVVPGYGDWALPDARLQELYKFDLDKAKQLMEQAGFKDGFSVTALTFTGYANDNAVVVQEQLKQLNIDMKIEQIEFGTFAQRVSNGEYDWVFTARGMRADVSGFVNDFRRLGIAADKWFPAWKNEQLEKAYDDGMATLDQAKRKPFFDKVQELTIEESPHIYLYQDYRFSAVSNKVKDYYVAFTTFRPALRSVWLDV